MNLWGFQLGRDRRTDSAYRFAATTGSLQCSLSAPFFVIAFERNYKFSPTLPSAVKNVNRFGVRKNPTAACRISTLCTNVHLPNTSCVFQDSKTAGEISHRLLMLCTACSFKSPLFLICACAFCKAAEQSARQG